MVSVSPAQISLAPGEQTTVIVTIAPGSLVPQGSIPRVAVEGYAGSQLLGGVVVDIVVPKYVACPCPPLRWSGGGPPGVAPYHVYLPLARK